MILCDTDVFIESLKNNPNTIKLLRKIGFSNIALSSITIMELYWGALNKAELNRIKNKLQTLIILPVDCQVSYEATNLIEKYAKSHNLKIPDALIAATAICSKIPLMTLNLKDFQYIDGITLFNVSHQAALQNQVPLKA